MSRLSLRARLACERGVTLVEVLVACVLLAGGVAATAAVFSSVFGTQAAAERLDVGVEYGTKALEDLRAMPYDEVAVSHNAAFPTPTGADHPAARLTADAGGTRYRRPGGDEEQLVPYAPSSPHPDYEVRTVGTQRLAIYRFVSWRDEECPIVDLAALDTLVSDLQGLLTTATGTLGGLLGPGGSLAALTGDGNGLLSGSLVGVLLAPLIAAVEQVLAVVDPINAMLGPLLSPLQGLLTAVNGVLDPVTGRLTNTIDLCDLPAGVIPSLAELQAVVTVLEALNPILGAIAPLVDHVGDLVHDLVSLNLFGLLEAVVKAPLIIADSVALLVQQQALTTLLGGVTDTLGNPTSLVSLATGLTTSLTDLVAFLAAPDTTHNTKRVTVAVQLLNPSGGHGPKAPVWMSTVITDPEDGLL